MPEAGPTEIVYLPLGQLDFDRENPRLLRIPAEGDALTDEEIAASLLEAWDPRPIGRSLAEYGFFPSEPLIAFPDEDRYVIAEGNRRLLAVRLLTDPELREAIGAKAWDELAEAASKQDLSQIPCEVVKDRDAAAPVIGYRHIVGIAKWEAYDKAAFVVHLLRDGNRTVEQVSDLVGESPIRVKRFLRDYLALEQAERAGIDVEPAKNSFGRFERAMHAAGIREYVGGSTPAQLTEDSSASVSDLDAMGKVMGYLYGLPGGSPALFTDTRRIDDLATALASEAGRDVLEAERDLDRAFDAAGGRKEMVLKGLDKALGALAGIAADFPDFANEAEIQQRVDAIRCALDDLPTGAQIPEPPEDGDYDLSSEEEYADEADDSEAS